MLSFLKDADQYKYGKNRVEADAKRLQAKEEELLKRREGLRDRLAQLRKERKGLRAAIEVNSGTRGPLLRGQRLCPGAEPHRLSASTRCFSQLGSLAGAPGQGPRCGVRTWQEEASRLGPGWVLGAVPALGADGRVVGSTSPRAPEVSGEGRIIRRSPGGRPPEGLEGAPPLPAEGPARVG